MEDEITIGSLAVQVEIRHSLIRDLRVLLVSPEGTVVALHDRAGGAMNNLFKTYTSLDHAGLAALAGERAQGEWTLTVGDYAGQDVGTLDAWSLEISEFAPVLAGGSAAVTASLVAVETPLGTPRLFADETLAVTLAYNDGTGVALSESLVTFDAESTAVSVTLDAALDATPGTLTAVVAGAVPVNAEIAPAALPMRIAPRRFRLSLSPGAPPGQFSATVRPSEMILTGTRSVGSSITVAESTTIKSLAVRVEISGVSPLVLQVRLRSPGGADVLLHGQTGGTELGFERAYTSRDHAGLAALAGESAQGEWTLMVADFSSGAAMGTLEAWGLEINGFAPVLAGGSAAVTASLVAVETPLGTPRLFAGETLAVTLAYNDGTGVALSGADGDIRRGEQRRRRDAGRGARRDARDADGGGRGCRSGECRGRAGGAAGGDLAAALPAVAVGRAGGPRAARRKGGASPCLYSVYRFRAAGQYHHRDGGHHDRIAGGRGRDQSPG